MDEAYSEQLGMYKRFDLRVGARFNHRKKRISHHIYIEIVNVANLKNDLQVKYNPLTGGFGRAKQFGFVPNIYYQIRF